MTKFIILIGQKYFCNYVEQKNYWLVISVEMNILKILQQLEAATEKGFGKKMFQKCWEILKDYKSERNPLKIIKARFW